MNALELQGLTKHYKDFTLGPLDLTLPGGTICGLIGENGAGKSTTIKLILDMQQKDGGTIKAFQGKTRKGNPKLLLLDEATNGLDPVVRDEVTDLLLDFARDENHSILISSHIVSDLEKLCDTIAFLHKGRLLLCEEKDALREEYALWHGTAAQLAALDTRVYGKRVTPYGAEALVRRDAMPAGAELAPVSIEELFVLMVKGENGQ